MAEAENKDLASRLESLESIARMLELKHKNSLEHSSRLEERESDLKKVEYLILKLWIVLIKNFPIIFFRNIQSYMIDTPNCSRPTSTTWNALNC